MARNVPDRQLTAKQTWELVRTGEQVVVIDLDDNHAYCAMADNMSMRAAIPQSRFKDWGNRGMRYVGMRKGALPKKAVALDVYPEFHLRKTNWGFAEV